MNLNTRLALLLAALAGVTATLVGVVGHRLTSLSFRNEIRSSLDSSATRLATPGGFDAQRSCLTRGDRRFGALVPLPGPAAGGGNAGNGNAGNGNAGNGTRGNGNGDGNGGGADRRPFGPAAAILVQCLDSSGGITFAPRQLDLPVTDADKLVAASPRGTRISRTVTVDGERFLQLTIAVDPSGAVQLARPLSENDNVLSSLVIRFGFLVAGSTALAGLAGLWVARRTTRPIVQLTAAAEEIAANGHLDVVLPNPRGNDETGRLTRSFSTMVDALRTSKTQQTQLVHDAGHELRTPITSLRTNIGVLRRHRDLPAETQARLVDDMHAELAELTSLVDELIALAADNGTDDPVRTVDLGQLVESTVGRWTRRSGRTITLERKGPEGLPIDGRPKILSRAVSNLLSNATKFSPEGTPVTVTISRASGFYEVLVRDSGPGIDAEDLPRIFDRFYRSTVHRDHPGSGLGLSIVASAASMHGGTVSARNNTDGPGTTFELRLPVTT